MASGITIVCREIDKSTGEIASYLCKRDAEDRDIQIVKIRGTMNPELTYYAIRTCVADDVEELEDVLAFLRKRRLSPEAVERYGGIVRL